MSVLTWNGLAPETAMRLRESERRSYLRFSFVTEAAQAVEAAAVLVASTWFSRPKKILAAEDGS
jgi:hypothetical protein